MIIAVIYATYADAKRMQFFFRLSFRNCISCVYNCDDHPSFNSSLRSSHIWFSYIHNFKDIANVIMTNKTSDCILVPENTSTHASTKGRKLRKPFRTLFCLISGLRNKTLVTWQQKWGNHGLNLNLSSKWNLKKKRYKNFFQWRNNTRRNRRFFLSNGILY